MNDELRERLDRIEAMLLMVLEALSEDQDGGDDGEPQLSLDGELLLGERDQGASL